VVEPARAEDEYLAADPGHHLVAVQFRLKNTGTNVYDESPWFDTNVIDGSGQHYDAAYARPTTAGVEFPTSLAVRPGDTALGYVSFEVPNGSRVVTVQFTMTFSDDIGEWTVPTRPAPAAHPATTQRLSPTPPSSSADDAAGTAPRTRWCPPG